MSAVLQNWKTTLAGAGASLTALGDIVAQLGSGHFGNGQIEKDVMTIMVGIGLIFAGDAKSKEMKR